MRYALLALLVVLAACPRGDSKKPDRAVIEQQRKDAIEKCQAALADATDNTRLVDATATYAVGCKDLYTKEPCHSSFARLPDTTPPERLHVLATACATTYCEGLAGPAPKLCGADRDTLAGQELADAWKELDRRILARELERDPDSPEIRSIAGMFPFEITTPAPDAPPPSSSNGQLHLKIATRPGGGVAITAASHTWTFSGTPSAHDLDPLKQLLTVAKPNVIIEADPDVPYAAVYPMLALLNDAGIDIAFSSR
jgi:hypothetical protein